MSLDSADFGREQPASSPCQMQAVIVYPPNDPGAPVSGYGAIQVRKLRKGDPITDLQRVRRFHHDSRSFGVHDMSPVNAAFAPGVDRLNCRVHTMITHTGWIETHEVCLRTPSLVNGGSPGRKPTKVISSQT